MEAIMCNGQQIGWNKRQRRSRRLLWLHLRWEMTELIFHVSDGKPPLTRFYRFIHGETFWLKKKKKTYIPPVCLYMSDESISFSSLPQFWRKKKSSTPVSPSGTLSSVPWRSNSLKTKQSPPLTSTTFSFHGAVAEPSFRLLHDWTAVFTSLTLFT